MVKKRLDLPWLYVYLTCPNYTWPSLTWIDITCPDLISTVLTYSDLPGVTSCQCIPSAELHTSDLYTEASLCSSGSERVWVSVSVWEWGCERKRVCECVREWVCVSVHVFVFACVREWVLKFLYSNTFKNILLIYKIIPNCIKKVTTKNDN